MAPFREGEHDSVLTVAFNGRVFGLQTQTGEVLWEHTEMSNSTLEILPLQRVVIVCTGTSLRCLDRASGLRLWKRELPDNYHQRPVMVLQSSVLYIGTGGVVHAFTLDGTHMWTQRFKGKGIARIALGFPGNVRQLDENT